MKVEFKNIKIRQNVENPLVQEPALKQDAFAQTEIEDTLT
jgi:hypothetical protein